MVLLKGREGLVVDHICLSFNFNKKKSPSLQMNLRFKPLKNFETKNDPLPTMPAKHSVPFFQATVAGSRGKVDGN